MLANVVPLVLIIALGCGAGFAAYKISGAPAIVSSESDKQMQNATAMQPVASADGAKGGRGSAPAVLLQEQQAAHRLNLSETTMVPFPPVITNLESPPTTWIRLEGAFAVKPSSNVKAADVAELVAPKVLAYLHSLSVQDLQGASGLEAMNMDLNEIARTASDGQVRGVLITGFVVE